MTCLMGSYLKGKVTELFGSRLADINHFWMEYGYKDGLDDLLEKKLQTHFEKGSCLVFTYSVENQKMLQTKYSKYKCLEVILCGSQDEAAERLTKIYLNIEDSCKQTSSKSIFCSAILQG